MNSIEPGGRLVSRKLVAGKTFRWSGWWWGRWFMVLVGKRQRGWPALEKDWNLRRRPVLWKRFSWRLVRFIGWYSRSNSANQIDHWHFITMCSTPAKCLSCNIVAVKVNRTVDGFDWRLLEYWQLEYWATPNRYHTRSRWTPSGSRKVEILEPAWIQWIRFTKQIEKLHFVYKFINLFAWNWFLSIFLWLKFIPPILSL